MAFARRGLHAEIVDFLGRRIVGGDPPEGATIDVHQLAAERDVSLTVIREAFKVLAAKGLIDARPKRGTYVCDRERWQLLDRDLLRWQFSDRNDRIFFDRLAELRLIVEPPSARLAAERRSESDLIALSDALTEMANAGADSRKAVEADVNFHRAVLAATQNELLQRMDVVLEAGLIARDRLVHGANTPIDPVDSHLPLFDAIKDRDGARAETAMRAILKQAQADLERAELDKP